MNYNATKRPAKTCWHLLNGCCHYFRLKELLLLAITYFSATFQGFGQQQNNPQRGIFESYVIVNSPVVNGGNDQFYDLSANTANPDFQGANLGSILVGQSIRMRGAQQKTYKNSGCDIFNGDMFYRVGNTGPFTEVDLFFEFNIGSNGDQQWSNYNYNVDISSSLAPGTYTVEVFTRAGVQWCNNPGNNGFLFISNNSANYIATFTVLQPIDCVQSEWSEWAPVNEECGITYEQTRTRTIVTEPQNGGAACGALTQTRTVTNDPCPIDCVLSEWSEWAPVNEECGITYEQTRTRTIVTEPQNGGAACGALTETRTVTNDPCPIDCVLSEWSEWAPVNEECGITYEQTRTRTIVTEPQNGGAACGALTETRTVTNDPCTVNCDPVLGSGSPTGVLYNAIEARWKGLNNTSGVNSALYLGNANMGAGGINRVQVGRNGLYNKPGTTPISFTYNPSADNLVATVGNRTVTYTSVSTKATGNVANMNVMTIMLRSGNGTNTGVLTLSNIVLNGYPLGDLVQAAASTGFWNVTNVDFSEGFTLQADIILTAGTYGSNENSKVDIWVGNNNSAVPDCGPSAIATWNESIHDMEQTADQAQVADMEATPGIQSDNIFSARIANNPSMTGDASLLILENHATSQVQVKVFDLSGRLMESLLFMPEQNQFWIGSNYATGLYLVEIISENARTSLRLLKQ